jgi:prepilin signal peptidase PulO-like enzyme (type II secretory pathway)
MFLVTGLLFILGLAMGSFASVIIHRLHKKEGGILLGRSKCPHCAHKLGVLDLIPLVSALACKMSCRYCKEPIPMMYPLLELCMGFMFLLTGALSAPSLSEPWTLYQISALTFHIAITFIFVTVSFYDMLFQEIPDEIMIPSIIVSLISVIALHQFTPQNLLIGIFVPVAFFGGMFFLSRGRWIGGGDVRIGALMGVLLGWPMIMIGLFLGYLLGAFYSLIGMLAGKLSRKSHIPFAPFLLIGTYIAYFWGAEILQAYMGFV